MYIVKKQTENNEQFYDFFIQKTVSDVNENQVVILEKIGSYNLFELENEKQFILNQLSQLQEKIDAINNII